MLFSRLNGLVCRLEWPWLFETIAFGNGDLVNLLSVVLLLICVELILMIVVTYVTNYPEFLSSEV